MDILGLFCGVSLVILGILVICLGYIVNEYGLFMIGGEKIGIGIIVIDLANDI